MSVQENPPITSPVTPASIRRRHQEVIDIEQLSSDGFNVLIKAVKTQISDVINNALYLQCLSSSIDRLLFSESIIYLVSTSTQSWMQSDSKIVAIIFFIIGVILSCLSMVTKYMQMRLKRDVDAYRSILLELIQTYGDDALQETERLRLGLPSHVLALGFFKNITTRTKNNS